MLVLLRQANIKFDTFSHGKLRLHEASFIRAKFVEIFEYGVVILPIAGEDNHTLIEKVKRDCWKEPNTGIVYDFLEIRTPDSLSFLPKHLEIEPAPSRQF